MNKKCRVCGIEKDLNLFRPHKNRKLGVDYQCKDCARAYDRKRYKDPTRRQYTLDLGKQAATRFGNYARKAHNCNRQFELTLEQFDLLTQKPCHYCGGFTSSRDYTGLDRIDSSLGYTLANVVPCCEICNRMKLALTVSAWFNQMQKILNHKK